MVLPATLGRGGRGFCCCCCCGAETELSRPPLAVTISKGLFILLISVFNATLDVRTVAARPEVATARQEVATECKV